jgi:hypothetical protein
MRLYKRSDAIGEIRRWIESLRSDPACQGMDYKAMQELSTDNAGEWGWTNKAWRELEKELEFKTIWTSPDRKEEAHYAERSVGIMEVTVKAMMLERDLPFSWWRHCAEAAVFLLCRFPILSQLSTMPADGDQFRPLEVVTGGAYSRRQIDRELSYFMTPGSPVLVHDPAVKGSQFQPKSSWWVVKGMYRLQRAACVVESIHTRNTQVQVLHIIQAFTRTEFSTRPISKRSSKQVYACRPYV